MESSNNDSSSNRVSLSEVVSDYVKRWFKYTLKEAKAGDINMQILLGQMYYNGYGVPRDAQKVDIFVKARDCLLPMGITSENVAQHFGVTRQEQDHAAVESHRRAAAASASGKFKDEIIPVSTKVVDPKTGKEKPVTILVDDGINIVLYFVR